jgi:hypothetical protein
MIAHLQHLGIDTIATKRRRTVSVNAELPAKEEPEQDELTRVRGVRG